MQKTGMAAGILLTGLFLWGCGNGMGNSGSGGTVEAAEALASQIEVQADGSIIETLVEDFSEDYYDGESLRSMILSEVEEYNRAHGDAGISLEGLEQDGGEVTVWMRYPSAEAYSQYNTDEYNQMTLFHGTVAQAYDAGYSLDVSLQDTKGGSAIGKEDILGMGEQSILISGTPMSVRVPGRVQYVSGNVTVDGRSEVRMSGEEESAEKYYVIYK